MLLLRETKEAKIKKSQFICHTWKCETLLAKINVSKVVKFWIKTMPS